MTDRVTASRPASRALPAALLLVAFAAGAASPIAVCPLEARASEARTARAMAVAVAVALDMLATDRVAAVLPSVIAADVAPAAALPRVRPVDAPVIGICHLGEQLLDLPPPARA